METGTGTLMSPPPNVHAPAIDQMPRRQRRTLAMGLLAQTRGEYHEALRCYIAASKRDPNDFLSLYFAALVSFQLKEKERAVRIMYASLKRHPEHPEAWYNLGKFYQDLGNLDKALQCYTAALEHREDFGQALVNLGNVLWELGDNETAESCYRRALDCKDGGPEAVYNLSFLLQLKGDWPKAFEAMEARWQCPGYYVEYRKPFMDALPRWHGEPLGEGQHLLLHGEQGAGDILQMLRYVPQLVQRTQGKLTVGVFDSQVRLCQQSFPAVHVVGTSGDIGHCTHHLPSMSLPYLLKTSWDNPPPSAPYFTAIAVLPKTDRYRIALCWAGSASHPRDRTRTIPFAELAPLLSVEGVEWVNLQFGEHADDWVEGNVPAPIATIPPDGDYLNTAELVKSCDLVITVDTSVAHLAGGLGVPVWMLVARFPDVRWQLDKPDTVWYPGMQLLRQTKAGEWTALIAIVRQLLSLKVELRDRGF